MPKGRKKKPSQTVSPLKIALLLVQLTLIKIGELPIWVIKLFLSMAKGGYLRTQRALDEPRLTWRAYPRRSHRPSALRLRLEETLALASQRVGLPTKAIKWQDPERWFSRKRGRPRKTSFLLFYFRKFQKFFKTRVPKKVKLALAFAIILVTLYLYTSFVLTAAYLLPSPQRLSAQQPLTTEIYDRGGKLLYRLYEGQNRTLIKLEDLPPYLIQATIAAEDKNFYRHLGFDLLAIARALYHNLTLGSQEGASTITQQVIKNSLLTPEKTISRKVREIILAFWTEITYSKDEILTMYFNTAPYGGPNTGIAAAAQAYFAKNPKDLTLSESAFLAGLPASPTQFSPYGSRPELSKIRQEWVLDRMVKEGYIKRDQKDQALSTPLAFKPQTNNILAPHFVFYVRDSLAQKLGYGIVSQGGLKVYTSLDFSLQQAIEKIVAQEIETLAPLNVRNGAAMVTDPSSGQILAMVGSRDYHYPQFGNFNATLSLRQPGSSIKVVTYATAFKKGYSPGNTILDTAVTFRDEWGNSYTPVNYDGRFHGPVSIRQALGSSLNIPAVKILSIIGLDPTIQTAKDLGISTFADPARFGLSLTLGGGEVRLIEMMGVYGTFASAGVLRKPTPIIKVTDSLGNVLEEYQDNGREVLSEEIAYLISHILSDDSARTIAFGANSLLNIPGSVVAVKTGTSDSKRDNWTFGFTKDFVVGVWVGNNDNSPMNPALTSGITGAAPIWNKIMKGLLANNPSRGFSRPYGVVEGVIDGRRDLIVAGNIPKALVRVKTEPEKTIFSDAFSSYATSSAQAAIKDGVNN